MKLKLKITIILFIVSVGLFSSFFFAFYLRHEGKYHIENFGIIYELRNGKFIVDGSVKGSFSYSFFARKVYVSKYEGIRLSDEPWPVWIHWNYIEMPDLKGGRVKYKRID